MDDRCRVTDADRDHAAALLRGHFVAGRITAGELDERLTVALRAVTSGDLRRVLADLPSYPVASPASRVRSQARLERGYRRLLAFYPAAQRRVHEEEMLAVLMTQAPAGKRSPGIAEAADLLLGALRIRCQPPGSGAGPGWRDALAVLSIILPVLILFTAIVSQARLLLNFPAPAAFAWGFPQWLVPGIVPPLALAAVALLGLWMRRAAVLAAAGLLILLVSGLPSRWGVSLALGDDYLFLAIGLEIAALLASPGPRRGLQILTWKSAALAVIAAVAVVLSPSPVTPAVMFAVIGVICAAMALTSSLGRWLLILLAIPGYPFFFPWAPFPIALAFLPPNAAFVAKSYLPSLILLTSAVVAACRRHLRTG